MSSSLLGGAPGERHRAICKPDSNWCDTHGGVLARRTPDADTEENRPGDPQGDSGNPGQTMIRKQGVGEKPRRKQNRVAHTTVRLPQTEAGQQTC